MFIRAKLGFAQAFKRSLGAFGDDYPNCTIVFISHLSEPQALDSVRQSIGRWRPTIIMGQEDVCCYSAPEWLHLLSRPGVCYMSETDNVELIRQSLEKATRALAHARNA
jgi:hypothetical protein